MVTAKMTVGGWWAGGSWVAGHAATVGVLGDPAAQGIAAAVITINLIGCIHGPTTWQVADDAGMWRGRAIPSLGFRGNGEAQGGGGSDESEDLFHSVLNSVFAGFRRAFAKPIQPLEKIFLSTLE